MKATFDRDPEKLTFFLNQMWTYLDCYALAYALDMAMVNGMTTNLEEKLQSG